LRDPKPAAQHAAASALSDIGPEAAEAVPELLNLLGHAHPGMRRVAAQTLAHMGRTVEALLSKSRVASTVRERRGIRLSWSNS
jgi:HEAT repeat protein